MRAEKHQPDYILMITVLMLTGIGIVTIYSASTVTDLHSGVSADHYAVRQLISAILGLILFGVIAYVPYQTWYKHASKLLLIGIGLLVVVLMPGIGKSGNGATRWIGSNSVHLQPSEVAVVVIVVYLSYFLSKKMQVLHDWRKSFRPALLVSLFLTFLVFAEPDMGTAMALFGTALVLFFASGLKLRPIFMTLIVMIPSAYLMAHLASYRSTRITAFLHPFQHPKHGGYQLIQGLTAIANGGLTGRGFDSSVMATGYLPEAHTDFIFAVFTEEWGWIGDFGLLAIFAVLIWRGFRIARYAPDRFGSLLAIGLTSTIIIQATINLGAVTWLLPVTGIPLPFISYGGTDILINLISMGILMSVSREVGNEIPEQDIIADIVSVDEFRAERPRAKAPIDSSRRRDRPAQVTSLSTRRRTTTFHDAGAAKGRTRREKTSTPQNRRNLSLSWRAQQEQSTRPSRDRNGTAPNRGSDKRRPKDYRTKR